MNLDFLMFYLLNPMYYLQTKKQLNGWMDCKGLNRKISIIFPLSRAFVMSADILMVNMLLFGNLLVAFVINKIPQ